MAAKEGWQEELDKIDFCGRYSAGLSASGLVYLFALLSLAISFTYNNTSRHRIRNKKLQKVQIF